MLGNRSVLAVLVIRLWRDSQGGRENSAALASLFVRFLHKQRSFFHH